LEKWRAIRLAEAMKRDPGNFFFSSYEDHVKDSPLQDKWPELRE